MKKRQRSESSGTMQLDPKAWNELTWVRVLIIAQLLLFAWQFSPILCDNGDNARYLILGKALIEGNGYRNIQTPREPIEAQYPILFPALLGIAQLSSDNLLLPKIAVSICGILITLLCFYLYKAHPQHVLWPMVLMVAVSGFIAEYSLILMSEVPYLLFGLCALYLREKSLEKPNSRLLFWTTIIVSVMPINCRSVGLAFSAAWIAANVWSKHYRFAVMHAAATILTITLFRSFVPSDPYFLQLIQRNSYDPDAGFVTPLEMWRRIVANMGRYSGMLIRSAMIPFGAKLPLFLNRVLSTISVGCIAVGWLRCLFVKKQRFIALYMVAYFGILCMWQPQWAGERFLVGIIPFLYLLFFYGLDALVTYFDIENNSGRNGLFRKLAEGGFPVPGARRRNIIWIAAVVIALFNLHYGLMNYGGRKKPTPDWRNYYSCADWARIHTAPDAVFVSRKPELFYMRSKRKGVVYPFTHNVEKVITFMEKQGVTHVVHDNFAWTKTTAKYLHPAIMSHPDRFKIVYALKNPDTFVLEFLKQ